MTIPQLSVRNGTTRNGLPVYRVFSDDGNSGAIMYRAYAERHRGDIVFFGSTMPYNVPQRLGSTPERKDDYISRILQGFCQREISHIESRFQRRDEARSLAYESANQTKKDFD